MAVNCFFLSVVIAVGLREPCGVVDVSGYDLSNRRLSKQIDSLGREYNKLSAKEIEAQAKADKALRNYQTIKTKYEKIKITTPKRPDYSAISDTSLMGKWAGHTR